MSSSPSVSPLSSLPIPGQMHVVVQDGLRLLDEVEAGRVQPAEADRAAFVLAEEMLALRQASVAQGGDVMLQEYAGSAADALRALRSGDPALVVKTREQLQMILAELSV